MTILVTGANGLLGQKLVALLAREGGHDVRGAGLGDGAPCLEGGGAWDEIDVRDGRAVRDLVAAARPAVVIHAAAMTHVDGCEDRAEEAMAVNGGGTENVARACAAQGAKMVYVSTEYVFDGASGPYGEDDPVRPLSAYARSKLEGETRAAALLEDLVVARTTILYGVHRQGALNFGTWLVRELEAGRPVRIVDDQVGSPTLADNLAAMLAALALSDRRGVYNTVGADVVDRHAFALRVAGAFGFDASLISPVKTADLGQKAPRPLRAGLRMDKFLRHFPDVDVLDLDRALDAFQGQVKRLQEAGG